MRLALGNRMMIRLTFTTWGLLSLLMKELLAGLAKSAVLAGRATDVTGCVSVLMIYISEASVTGAWLSYLQYYRLQLRGLS